MLKDLRNKRVFVKGLCVSCPFCKPKHDCPLKKLRGLPTTEIDQAVDAMPLNEINAILEHHRVCMGERDAAGHL